MGNGLRTIGLNIASLAKESENYVTANGKVNISLRDSQGEMRSTFDILKDLYTGVEGQSVAWKDLSNTQKAAIGEALAGKNQYNVLTSVMQNFESAIKAAEAATNSQGSAAKENAVYMESLEAKVANLKNEFQELAVDFLDSKTIGAAIDGISKFISFLDTDLGLVISKIGLFGGVLGGAVHIYGGIISKLVGVGKGFVDLFKKAAKAGEAVKKTAEAAKGAAEAADAVGDIVSKKKGKVKEAAAEVVEAGAEMAGAAAEIGEAGAEISKGASKTADAAGDAAKAASKTVKAGAEVADTVGDVAGAAGGLSPIFSKLSGVTSKIGGAFGGMVGKVLPVVGGIAALAAIAKSAYKEVKNSNPITALDDDLDALHSKEAYLENTIQKLQEMGVGIDSSAIQNFNAQLANTKKQIDEIDEKKIQALFGTSELESHGELKGTGYDRRGETGISFSDKPKVQELTDEYNNLIIAMKKAEQGPDPEKVIEYSEKVQEKQTELFDLWGKLVEAKQRGFEITPEMAAFGSWMEKTLGLNLEEAVYGTNSVTDQLNRMSQLQPSFEQLGVAMGQIGQEGTDNYQILTQLNDAFQGVEGWEERMNSFYSSLQAGDIKGFTNEVRDFAMEMVTSSMGVENFVEADSELIAKTLEATGAFGNYKDTLKYVEDTQKAVNDAVAAGIDGHTEQAVAALYATGLFESEGQALDYLRQKRQEVNENPVNTDESTSELNEEKNAANGAKDGLDQTKQGQDNVTNNPANTGASVSELNNEEGAAGDAYYQLTLAADGQMLVTQTPINTGQQQGALNALKRAAQGVVSALQSAWNWFQKVSGLKFGPGVGQSISVDAHGRPVGGRKNKPAGSNIFRNPLKPTGVPGPWNKAQGGSIEETGEYWVGEQGPEIVTLPRGAEVVSNKDIERKTGLKVDKNSFDGTAKQEDEEQEEIVSSNRGFAQGTVNPHNNTGLPSNPIHRVVKKQITTLFTNLTDYSKQVNNYYNIAAKGAKKVVELAEKENEELEKQIKLFDAQTDIIEHKLFLLEKNGATDKEQIQLLKKMQAEVAKKADDYRKQGYDDESEVIRDLQKKWKQTTTYVLQKA